MEPKYKLGQEVTVKSAENQSQSARDSNIGEYAGKRGAVTNYYWVSPTRGTFFYIYIVKLSETGQKELVLHEDEIEAGTAAARRKKKQLI
ncbi:hypothetical protein ACFLWW_03305 [Chloroflexota bacterium]